jgi:hypothetical protein
MMIHSVIVIAQLRGMMFLKRREQGHAVKKRKREK